MTTEHTLEQVERWTRLMAECEGWADIRSYDGKDRPCGCAELNPASDYGWNEDQESPLIGKPPDEEADDWHLPNYQRDANALGRVCRKICEKDRIIELHEAFAEAYVSYLNKNIAQLDRQVKDAKIILPMRVWQACLTAEELFLIVGEALEEIERLKEAK